MSGIEIMLPSDPEHEKMDIVVDGTKSQQTKRHTAKQRWTKLTTAAQASSFVWGKRSMKADEHDLLRIISTAEADKTTDIAGDDDDKEKKKEKDRDDDEDDSEKDDVVGDELLPTASVQKLSGATAFQCGNRKALSQALDGYSDLPEQESQYLRSLIASPHVSSDLVAKARRSVVHSRKSMIHSLIALRPDEFAHLDDDEDDEEEETRDSDKQTQQHTPPARLKQSLRPKINKDASFRKELWLPQTLETIKKQDEEKKAAAKKAAQEEALKKKQEEAAKREEEKKKERPTLNAESQLSSFFNYIIGGLSSTSVDETPEEEKHREDDDDDDVDIEYKVLGTTGSSDPDCSPHVLNPILMHELRRHLPQAISYDHFWLKYSLHRDGASMRVLIHHLRNSSRTLVAIETTRGDVIGAFCSSPWIPNGTRFFGSGESFVWRLKKSRYTPCATVLEQVELERQVHIFPWSGQNHNVQRLEHADGELMLGGGVPDEDDGGDRCPRGTDYATAAARAGSLVIQNNHGSALVLSPDLGRGYSHPCHTFCSPRLPPSCQGSSSPGKSTTAATMQKTADEHFEIANIEVWTLTPVDTVEQAETVELGRRFIFDHSSFVEM